MPHDFRHGGIKNLDMTKEKGSLSLSLSLVYAVPDFNITNIVITLCLQKVVLVVGACCVMSFIYGFNGPFKHIPLVESTVEVCETEALG